MPSDPDLYTDRRTFIRNTLLVGLGAACGGFWMGCGNSEPAEKSVVKNNRRLIAATAVDLYTIDPAQGFDIAICGCLRGLYDSLFRHVGNPPRAIPWLVKAFEHSDDVMSWIFHLDERARFHNGAPLTASAVQYSVKRLMEINKGPASLFSGVIDPDSFQVINDHTLNVKLIRPFIPFLDALCWLFILDPEQVRAHDVGDYGSTWLADHEAGSGPFTITGWQPGELYEFQAVNDYWRGWPAPEHISGYALKVIKGNAERVRALESGTVSMINWTAPAEQKRLQGTGFEIIEEPSYQTFEIKLNQQTGYTADVHVRKALLWAMDYEALMRIYKGRALRNHGPLPPNSPFIPKNLKGYRTDMAQAKAILKKSPWPNGGFTLYYVYVAGLEEEREVGKLLGKELAKLNINLNILSMAWGDAVSTFENPKWSPDMFPIYSMVTHPDPDNYLWSAFHSSQAGKWTNPGYYRNPEMDKILEAARISVNIDHRLNLYHQAQQKVLEEAVNIFCISNMDDHVFSPEIQRGNYCPVMGGVDEYYWYRMKSSVKT